jgi:hypothetical protein
LKGLDLEKDTGLPSGLTGPLYGLYVVACIKTYSSESDAAILCLKAFILPSSVRCLAPF